jgi:hypothetical protein
MHHRLAPAAAIALALALPVPSAAADGAQESFWAALQDLCGEAFGGVLRYSDAVDADLAGKAMVMHVRTCSERRVEIPFHVGDDRSRTWVLTRTAAGIRLQHDHRHQDGSADATTLYGGETDGPGTASEQRFPADESSRELFTRTGRAQATANVWSLELVPGERFSYALRRPGRHFQVDFDLRHPVPAPPAPWGW